MVSSSGLIVRSIEEAGVWQINIYRSLAFVLVVFLIMRSGKRGKASSAASRIDMPAIWGGLVLGATGVAFTQALTTTTIANTMFIMSGIPFVTMAIAFVFLNERISRFTLIAMAAAAGGVILMVTDAIGAGDLYGNVMALLTALGFSVFAVIVRAGHRVDMLPSLIIAGLFVIAASIIPAWGNLGITLPDLLLCLFWGGVLSGLGHWIYINAARYLLAAELTLFLLVEFALAPIWVWYFAHEVPSTATLYGGSIVIIAVAIRTLAELRPRPAR